MREWRCTFGKSKQNDDNDKNLCDLTSYSVRSSSCLEAVDRNLIDSEKAGMDLQRCELLSQVRWTWLMMLILMLELESDQMIQLINTEEIYSFASAQETECDP